MPNPRSSPQGWLSNFPSLLLRNLSTNTSCPRVGKFLPSQVSSCCWGSGWAEPCVVTIQVSLLSIPWEGSMRPYYGADEECEAPEAGACPSPTASRSQSPFLSPLPCPPGFQAWIWGRVREGESL